MCKLTTVRTLIALGVVGASVLTACGADQPAPTSDESANEQWEPTFVEGVLQPLPDGFPSEPIVLINSDEASHDDGLYARAMQQALEAVSPVPTEVRDQAYPQFGTWVALQDALNETGGDQGYYAIVTAFTGAAMDMLTEPIEEELGTSIDDLSAVIATEDTPFVMVTRADAPWQTYQEMVDAAKANPDGVRYVAATGSRLDVVTRRIMKHGDWSAHTIPTDGSQEAATVVGAGEGDFTMLTPSVARAHEQAGTVRVILVTSNEDQPPSQWSGAVTTSSIGMPDEAWGTLRGFSVPSVVPASHRQWLFEAFLAASKQQAHKDRVGSVPGAEAIEMNGEELDKAMRDTIANNEQIIRDLGLHHDQ